MEARDELDQNQLLSRQPASMFGDGTPVPLAKALPVVRLLCPLFTRYATFVVYHIDVQRYVPLPKKAFQVQNSRQDGNVVYLQNHQRETRQKMEVQPQQTTNNFCEMIMDRDECTVARILEST